MSETERIAQQLERTWAGDAWHGPSLKELTDGLTAKAGRRASCRRGALDLGTRPALSWLDA